MNLRKGVKAISDATLLNKNIRARNQDILKTSINTNRFCLHQKQTENTIHTIKPWFNSPIYTYLIYLLRRIYHADDKVH